MDILEERLLFFSRSYKITPRAQNAHAYINAAFLVKAENLGGTFVVQEQPRLVFGGVNAAFTHATQTESMLIGQNLNDNSVLSSALAQLDMEVSPEADPVLASVEYRKHLVKALFYKVNISSMGSLLCCCSLYPIPSSLF